MFVKESSEGIKEDKTVEELLENEEFKSKESIKIIQIEEEK